MVQKIEYFEKLRHKGIKIADCEWANRNRLCNAIATFNRYQNAVDQCCQSCKNRRQLACPLFHLRRTQVVNHCHNRKCQIVWPVWSCGKRP